MYVLCVYSIINFLVFAPVSSYYIVFVPDDAAVHPITFKIEAFNPVVRVDDQTFVPSIIEMVTKEAFQGILRQLILAELPKQMVAAVGNGKGCLRLFVSGMSGVCRE